MVFYQQEYLEKRGLTQSEKDLWWEIDTYEHGMRPVWEGGMNPTTMKPIEGRDSDLSNPRDAILYNGLIAVAERLRDIRQDSFNSTLISKIGSVPSMKSIICDILSIGE